MEAIIGKSTPAPPDPKDTAAASTSTNVNTAIANAMMGNISENGPDGSTSVTQSGSYQMKDPYTGQTVTVPTFTRNTTLSGAQQSIHDQQNGAKLNLASLGNNLSGQLGGQLTSNFKMGNEASEGRLFELGRKRLDPMFAQQQEGLEARLANQGIMRGSAQYDNAQRQQYQGQNDAYNQLLLSGRAQANNEQLTEDNQRINQIGALLSGGQVSQQNFMGANMPTIATTDTAGIINNDYQNRLNIANQQNSQTSNILGGLFGLGSKLIASDTRLKTDIKRIGKADNGLPIYAYRYLGSEKTHIGFMAQEVEKLHPHAVHDIGHGFKGVNYAEAVQ